MCTRASGMHDAFWNTLVVKMRDFFTHDEIFEQRRAASTDFQGVLIVGNLHSLIGAQRLVRCIVTKGFETVQFDVGVATVQGVGPGHLALAGRRFFAAHQT